LTLDNLTHTILMDVLEMVFGFQVDG